MVSKFIHRAVSARPVALGVPPQRRQRSGKTLQRLIEFQRSFEFALCHRGTSIAKIIPAQKRPNACTVVRPFSCFSSRASGGNLFPSTEKTGRGGGERGTGVDR